MSVLSLNEAAAPAGAVTSADLARLRDPFAPEDIEWRVQSAGEKNGKPWARVLAYVTNRAIMDRLDEVCGPANWQNVYREGPAGGVICGISIRVQRADGTAENVVKWDGAENTDVEPVKGGLSNSMKRSAVMWGCGRYLYHLEEGWANVHDGGANFGRTKDGKSFRWDPPTLPEWAMPRPQAATADQLALIEALLAGVKSDKVAAGVRQRVEAGLTRAAADDAVRFLVSRAAVDAGAARAA